MDSGKRLAGVGRIGSIQEPQVEEAIGHGGRVTDNMIVTHALIDEWNGPMVIWTKLDPAGSSIDSPSHCYFQGTDQISRE
jgi:hypothetical protein